MATAKIEPFAISAREAARVTGFGLRHLQKITKAGECPAARKMGRKYVYLVDDLREWVRNAPQPGSAN